MIYLLTGTPGHCKTQRALWMLLNDKRFKGRTILHANVRGLKTEDERLKNWLPLTDITQWQTAPTGCVILVDECHQDGFFPVRGVGKPPKWIEGIAEHRHLGIDFVLVTQNAKNMDVFVRRLVELHIHCKRPAQLGYTNLYEFQGYTDCDERVPSDKALRHERWKLDKSIWTLYDSSDQHTAVGRLPRMMYLLPVFVLLFVGVLWYAYHFYAKKMEPAKPPASASAAGAASGTPGADKNAPRPVKSDAVESLSRMSPKDRVEYNMHETRDWGFARVPVDPDYPESAPIYDDLRIVKTFPRVSGCVVSKDTCKCVDQQGTPARISVTSCFDFVVNGRFDPYRDEQAQAKSGIVNASSSVQHAAGSQQKCSSFTVYGLTGVPSIETRCDAAPAPLTPAAVVTPSATVTTVQTSQSGQAGQTGSAGTVPAFGRGGFVDGGR